MNNPTITPHIPNRPGHWFSVVWRSHCVSRPADGWQPLTSSGGTIDEAIANAEQEVEREARNSDLTPANLKEFAPMPHVEIKHVCWENGRCEIRDSLLSPARKARLRKVWMDNIPENHPDHAQSA